MGLKMTMKTYEYHVWANKKVFGRLRELPDVLIHQPVQDVFPTIYAGLEHIYMFDNVWLMVMKGSTMEEVQTVLPGVVAETKNSSLNVNELEFLFEGLASRYREFLGSGEDLLTVKQFHHPVYGVLHASLFELVQHVVNHDTYHRGNISSMIRQLGHAGAASDMVFYYYDLQ
ncbi:DinB family protein [Paenibacillus thalictri]|uniref:Damage-inducible protein DinB n=1 Tax=Paenibacillus thalictri TaxID=2527873 RepID=A0A4Q9DVI7_9BACL|nr:DinB family protein [Paenibacillus thalictri]TBL79688.1 damage-inducible protein DinB [Paenibacillus thalictri]